MLARGFEGKYPVEIESIDLNEIISSFVVTRCRSLHPNQFFVAVRIE
jgi:hypothetical protein